MTLGWQSKALRAAHALAPGVTATVLGLVDRLLPDPPPGRGGELRKGMELHTPLAPSRLTRRMNRAAGGVR